MKVARVLIADSPSWHGDAMLTLDDYKSKGNERLAWVAAHPPKVGEGRAPAFVAGLARAKATVRHPPRPIHSRQKYELEHCCLRSAVLEVGYFIACCLTVGRIS